MFKLQNLHTALIKKYKTVWAYVNCLNANKKTYSITEIRSQSFEKFKKIPDKIVPVNINDYVQRLVYLKKFFDKIELKKNYFFIINTKQHWASFEGYKKFYTTNEMFS